MASDAGFVLVTGATGRQGGAVARALLASGTPVRGLVRDPSAPKAVALRELGVKLAVGDFDDPASLPPAFEGARAVFSVQMPDMSNLLGDGEVRQGRAIVEAARTVGVEQVVHTSVSGTGERADLDEQEFGVYLPHYWRSKAAVERAVRDGGFSSWTILRPSTLMENFNPPSFYFAEGSSSRLLLAGDLDNPQPFVALKHIGAAAAAAFNDPERFAGVELELAGDLISFREAAAILSEVRGTPLVLPSGPADFAELSEVFIMSQRYIDEHPMPARPEFSQQLGVPTTTLREWAAA